MASKRLLALALFREQKLSIGGAAELCGVTVAEFHEFARQHLVPIFQYGTEQQAEDARALIKLGLG